jgi:5-methylcytosine-specific restriction endonuclease McrA
MDKVLVLNSDYTPINVTTLTRGFILVDKGKAEVLKSGENPIISGKKEYIRPLIIRLLNYVRFRVKPLKINRQRVFKRDGFRCVYCGVSKNLTIDHVIPKSRGGGNTWLNLVTCCKNCNRVKDNKTPEEAGMKFLSHPFEPSIFSEVINPSISNIWEDFKKSYY